MLLREPEQLEQVSKTAELLLIGFRQARTW